MFDLLDDIGGDADAPAGIAKTGDGFFIFMSYVFAFTWNLGVLGVWYGLSLGLTLAAVLLFWRFNHVSKRV